MSSVNKLGTNCISSSNPSPARLLTTPRWRPRVNRSNFSARRNAELVRGEAVTSLSRPPRDPERRSSSQVGGGGAVPGGRGSGGEVGWLGASGALHGAGPGREEAGVAAAAGAAGGEVRDAEGVAR